MDDQMAEMLAPSERRAFPHEAAAKTALKSAPGQDALQDDAGLDRFLSIHEVKLVTSLGKSAIYEQIAAGRFPKPIPIAERRVAWSARAIARWQRACVTEVSGLPLLAGAVA